MIIELLPTSALLAVADSMGRLYGGEIASQIVIYTLADIDHAQEFSGEFLADCIKTANESIDLR